MTKYPDADRAAALARNEAAASMLAVHAGWEFERPIHLPPAIRTQALFVSQAELLIVPMRDLRARRANPIDYATKVARCDAITVGVGTQAGRPTGIHVVVTLWARPEPAWHSDLRAWCSSAGQFWLAAEPHAAEQIAFELGGGRLRASKLPWPSDHDRDAGFARAESLLVGEAR